MYYYSTSQTDITRLGDV